MMNIFQAFAQDDAVAAWVSQYAPYVWLLLPLAIIDLALKGWGMWRAAKMNKNIWFIALLLVNSMGILPAIFLLITKREYEKRA